MSVLENIRFLCNRTDTTVPTLEKELGLGKGSIYKWDKNSPSIDKIQKVADYFGVPTDFLIYGYDKELESLIKDLAEVKNGRLTFPNEVVVLMKVRFEPLKREYYDVPLDIDAVEMLGLIKQFPLTTEFKKALLSALEDVKSSYREMAGVRYEPETIALLTMTGRTGPRKNWRISSNSNNF
ncbi:helix-turn-helix domain-containing protein [Paenibacillus sp. P25]|nr:helix-turn-helix domain-containing protein [Paenibacillus sp. P25]